MSVATPWIESAALIFALLLGVGLAIVVLVVAPRRRANRLLALLFALSGATTWLYGDWGAFSVHPATAAFNALSTALLSILYVELLVEVLDTPLIAPLRRRGVRIAIAIAFVATLVPMAAAFRDAARVSPFDIDAVYNAQGPALALSLLVLVYALLASISAWRRAAKGSASRARAGHLALAFGARDATVALAIVTTISPELAPWVGGILWPLATILSVPLLAYGILKAQLFDIDLRLKEGVRRGTILSILLVAFAALAIAVERATTQAIGIAAGGVGVALLLLAFVPLERFAARVADRFFPNVRADDEYIGRRKLEVYRAALEDALVRDPASAASDRVLADLRRALFVTNEQHEILLVALRPRPSIASAVPPPFEIVSELGRGGFGRALLARDKHLDRYVVLKQPLGLLAAGSAGRDMFLREARLAAQIQHPNVVAVHQVIPDRDPPILVLEHVNGESLADRLAREGVLAPDEVARIALDVLAGLDRIHRAGIVHRDLKPANILLTRDGTAKITDFGVAHAPADPSTARVLTTTGFQPGSPAYMSPEQSRGRPVDARSDLYSLGVVLHEALTGRLPATRDVTLPVHRAPVMPAASKASEGQDAPQRVVIAPPPALGPLLDRALDESPARRFADAPEMASALRRAMKITI